MRFQFDSLGDFFAMAGHGPYVWGCYLLTAAALVYLVVSPIRKRQRFIMEQSRQQRLMEHRGTQALVS